MGSKWEKVKLCEIGKIVTGKTPPTKKTENFGNIYPFITPRDIYDQKYVRNTERCLSRKGFNTLKNKVIPPNSICVSCIGSDMGKVVMSSRISITNQQINSVIPNKEYNPSFIYYCLKPKKDYFKSIAGGTTMPILNKTDFSNIEITLPPLPEQQKVASILSAFDDKIELNNEMNKTLEEIAQAVFKHWFIDFEFPNANGEPYKSSGGEFEDSELGPIPKGWRVGNLDDIINITSGKRPASRRNSRDTEYSIPLVGASSIMGYVKEALYKEPVIIIGRVGTLGVVQRYNNSIWASDNTLVITSQYFEYVYQALKLLDYNALNRGSTQPLITQGDIKNLPIIIPKDSIINLYEKLGSNIHDRVVFNKRENQTLSQLRDTLLPKLVSGEIRVV